MNLSKIEYWDSLYKGNVGVGIGKNYAKNKLWGLYHKHLPKGELKVLEVGCAPGGNLIKFHEEFGYSPFGVEYSGGGAWKTKELFINYNLNPNHVVKSDFFNNTFQRAYKEKFDVVFSSGFLEHFDNPGGVIVDHLKLLKKDGYLVIVIPNLKGLNLLLMRFFNPKIIKDHNLKIMNKRFFKGVFIEELYCDYVGTINFNLQNTQSWWKLQVLRVFYVFQMILDRVLPKNLGENKNFSPYLVFIGRKRF